LLGINGYAKGVQDTMAVKAWHSDGSAVTVDRQSLLFVNLEATGTAGTVTADLLLNLHGKVSVIETLGDRRFPPPPWAGLLRHNQKGNDQARIDIQTADGSDGHITADISERQSSCASNLDLEIWDPTHQAHIDWASLHGNGQSTATASRNVRVENCQ